MAVSSSCLHTHMHMQGCTAMVRTSRLREEIINSLSAPLEVIPSFYRDVPVIAIPLSPTQTAHGTEIKYCSVSVYARKAD